jgi:hypothetical protein
MSDLELIDAVAQKTGESVREISRRGFFLVPPVPTADDPECVFDLIDLPDIGGIDWEALGFNSREPFSLRDLKTRRKSRPGISTRTMRRLTSVS